jgi:tetratricopeptide (TPR) repeat protein
MLLLASCGAHSPSSTGNRLVPALPRLAVENFQPKIRERVRQAYVEAQSHPSDAGASGKLGMVLHAFEQYDSAEICYRRARGLDARQFQWAYYLGLIEALNGRNKEAAATLREAATLDGNYLPARLKLAEVLLTLRRLDESEAVLQSIARDDAGMAPAYYWMGRAAEARGRAEEAAKQYRRAGELWPSYGTAHYALALVSGRAGDAAAARQEMAAYEKYKANGDPQPEDPLLEAVRALDNTALAHLMKGVDLENAGRLQEAVAEHEEAVKLDPKLAQAHANLIALYARLGKAEEAEREYLATVAINPSLPQSHYDYGVFLVSLSRFGEAEAAFRKALSSSPNYAEAHSNLGAMLERQGKLEEARKEYQAAVENKPNFRQAHFQLGRLLMMMKRPGDAIPQLSQTLTPEDGDTPRFMYALGVAYAESGDYASAGRWLRDAGGRAASQGQDRLAAEIGATMRKVEQRVAR